MTQLAEPTTDLAATPATDTVPHWIGGGRVAGNSGRRGPVFDPATGKVAREVDFASIEEVDKAVAAARSAFPAWRATSLSKRTEIMFRIRNLIDQHRKELAAHLTAEHGKVPSDALGEIARGLENVEFATGVPHLMKGAFSEQVSTGVDVYQIRQPLGVVAGITPFNFPAMVPMWMFANAIACGNTFILKPSEKDPSAAIYLAELLAEAGVPAGVFNVVNGDKVAVDRILEHPEIAAVSFVGSTPIARYIYETGTKHGKRVQALGGAKNHMIVLPDADIDMAADAAVSAAYGSSGERCMAIATVVAVGGAGDAIVEAIKQRLPKIKIGPGTDPSAEMGPLVTKQHRDKVASYLDLAKIQGAKVVEDGRTHPLYKDSEGFFLGASLIDDVAPGMDCYSEEIFGPVLTVTRVDTYGDALQLVNDNPYGNGTAIFTRDGGAARQYQFDVNVGMVGINVPIPVPVAYYSFGGWKASLFGDLHMYG
ncbi:MAG TPA: CoA-acylating methylmalonate-semialdehyde dehydrogenase, partial [Candidatus Limnocylindrales bacterium]|nr:CoA-acylating methylmalonate-semialdehyde dehydrogenase [Candidatus Limnocylindrales bacterium]